MVHRDSERRKLQTNIQEYFLLRLEDSDMQNLWYKQDGATSHTARETMAIPRAAFPGRLIARFGDVPWPPRSPDLTSYGDTLKERFTSICLILSTS